MRDVVPQWQARFLPYIFVKDFIITPRIFLLGQEGLHLGSSPWLGIIFNVFGMRIAIWRRRGGWLLIKFCVLSWHISIYFDAWSTPCPALSLHIFPYFIPSRFRRDKPLRRLPFPTVTISWNRIFPFIWWQLDPYVSLAIPTTVPFLFPSHLKKIFTFCVPKESMPTWQHVRFLIDAWLSFEACLQCKVGVVFFL